MKSTPPAFVLQKTVLKPMKELRPAKWNPRLITDARFKTLCDSIADDPQFMVLRPVLATKKGTIYAGNQRFRALEHLGYKECPTIVTDIDEKTAKKRALKDNNHFGDWQMDELANLVVEFSPLEIELMGMPPSILKNIQNEEEDKKAAKIKSTFEIVIECESEEQQQEFFEELSQSYTCRLLTL